MNNNRRNIFGIIGALCIVIILTIFIFNQKTEDGTMLDFVGKNYREVEFFTDQYKLDLNINYEENTNYEEGTVIFQSISEGTIVKENQELDITVVKNNN